MRSARTTKVGRLIRSAFDALKAAAWAACCAFEAPAQAVTLCPEPTRYTERSAKVGAPEAPGRALGTYHWQTGFTGT